ncbi:MAG: oxidoreductase [Aquirhabdus sp.]
MNSTAENEMTLPIAVVIGATGLVGRQLLSQLLATGHYREVYAVVRKRFDLASTTDAVLTWIEIPDFTQLKNELQKYDFQDADAFSTLGSTLKQAGSKAAFYQIDHDYNLAFAEVTQQQGARHLLLVSAMGADTGSMVYYNRVKGELEQDVQHLNFAHCSIFRPSLLLGERQDSRLLEGAAQSIFQWGNNLLPKTFYARPITAQQVATAMYKVAVLKSKTLDQDQATKPVYSPERSVTSHVEIYSNKMMLSAS